MTAKNTPITNHDEMPVVHLTIETLPQTPEPHRVAQERQVYVHYTGLELRLADALWTYGCQTMGDVVDLFELTGLVGIPNIGAAGRLSVERYLRALKLIPGNPAWPGCEDKPHLREQERHPCAVLALARAAKRSESAGRPVAFNIGDAQFVASVEKSDRFASSVAKARGQKKGAR